MKEQDPEVKWFNTVFYPPHRTCRAIRYDRTVLPRLRQSRITLFTPWGPRYSWQRRGVVIQENDKEVEVLNFLATLFNELRQKMPNKTFRWVFLGADLYGTRINHMPTEVVARYFDNLSQWLNRLLPEVEFWLWSKLDERAEEYRQKVREEFETLVSRQVLSEAARTAHKMGRGGSPKDYLVERLAEAALIEEILKPVKISCVSRRKDEGVDGELPCLYFLPEHLQAPWL